MYADSPTTILTAVFILKLVCCENMKKGTELVGNPYSEAVYIQQKPDKTICMGIVVDEVTVYTSILCDIGDKLTVDKYHVTEAPHFKFVSPVKHNIRKVQRGKRSPFDLKVIKLADPFEFGGKSNVTSVLWVETYDDYTEYFKDVKDNPQKPAVVLGFGAPFKGGVVRYDEGYDCKQDYKDLKEPDWPGTMTYGGFCIYEGKTKTDVSIPHKKLPVSVEPGIPGDDSFGSMVKIEGLGRAIGILIKAVKKGGKEVSFGWGSYYMLSGGFTPDDNWPTTPATTSKPPGPYTTGTGPIPGTTGTGTGPGPDSTPSPSTTATTTPSSTTEITTVSIAMYMMSVH